MYSLHQDTKWPCNKCIIVTRYLLQGHFVSCYNEYIYYKVISYLFTMNTFITRSVRILLQWIHLLQGHFVSCYNDTFITRSFRILMQWIHFHCNKKRNELVINVFIVSIKDTKWPCNKCIHCINQMRGECLTNRVVHTCSGKIAKETKSIHKHTHKCDKVDTQTHT
jgi:hypothetical protein